MSKKKFITATIIIAILEIIWIVASIQEKSPANLVAILIAGAVYAFIVFKFKKSSVSQPAASQTRTNSDPNGTYSKVRGVTFQCEKENSINRQEVLKRLKPNEKLTIEKYEYNGEPAVMLLNSKGLDVGNLSAEMSKKYYNKNFEVYVSEITGGNGKNLGCNIIIKLLWFNQYRIN